MGDTACFRDATPSSFLPQPSRQWLSAVAPATTDTTDQGTGDDTSGTTQSSRTLSGSIVAPESAKRAPYLQAATEPAYQVLVQSVDTLETYTGQTDGSGQFEIEIPEDETGDTFMVTVVMPEGKPGGPVLFGTDGDEGVTGLELVGDANLGTIQFPDDTTQDAIEPGTDADLGESAADGSVIARLNEDGVPIGVPTFGRGDDAAGTASDDDAQQADRDQDGPDRHIRRRR
ncbi:hypothetical protein [uncultured Ilyobacter sp.]|uniref:hypothetical protein n=1 Tax=uncultured Ilyobacter sp. TaxID=544433 RepID=UPI0029F5539E|nr:hypothetical protein [uncultured Ilyobacter sp.]